MHLSDEEKKIGKENYAGAVGSKVKAEHTSKFSRRDFIKASAAAGGIAAAGFGAAYYGYSKPSGNPVRIGIIGTGDEGNVLIGALNPDFVEVVAIADIRPYNIHRTFFGDESSANALKVRPGLIKKFPDITKDNYEKKVEIYRDRYIDLLKDKNVEAVIIALPLHLHAKVAIEAMKHGKHVLTEKLMAHDIGQCKKMSRISFEEGKLLATGHQRHYSILYENAVDMIRMGLLGYIHHIRAQWHRGNMPGKDSWQKDLPDQLVKNIKKQGGEITEIDNELADIINDLKKAGVKKTGTSSRVKKMLDSRKKALAKNVRLWNEMLKDEVLKNNAKDYGYIERKLANGTVISPLEELIRWRLWERTGGGLMAELGSHQLDAAGIFISAMNKEGKKARPLTVSATGGRYIFPLDRDCYDHVYCSFEFEGPDNIVEFDKRLEKLKKPTDYDNKVVVTYSSINGNGFGGYGEVVMGTKGTLVLATEKDAMLFGGSNTKTNVKVSNKSSGPTLDTTASGGADVLVGKKALDGPVSRGYKEEIEHWAWCIRQFDEKKFKSAMAANKPDDYLDKPRCHPEVALSDAIIALTSNLAMMEEGKYSQMSKENKNMVRREGNKIEFQPEWFDINNDATPDGSTVSEERIMKIKS